MEKELKQVQEIYPDAEIEDDNCIDINNKYNGRDMCVVKDSGEYRLLLYREGCYNRLIRDIKDFSKILSVLKAIKATED